MTAVGAGAVWLMLKAASTGGSQRNPLGSRKGTRGFPLPGSSFIFLVIEAQPGLLSQ